MGCKKTTCIARKKENEALRQRLEHALYENQRLLEQIGILKESLDNMQWQMKAKGQTPPALPVEIWRYIFEKATQCEGLAYSRLDGRADGSAWQASLVTRRSIPLVSKQWNISGTQYLYEHVVLYYPQQFSSFKRTLHRHPEYASICRDFEVILLIELDLMDTVDFWEDIRRTAEGLRRLRSLAFDSVVIPAWSNACNMKALRPSLEILHLPSIIGDARLFPTYPEEEYESNLEGQTHPWLALHTLCLVSGRIDHVGTFEESLVKRITPATCPSLRTISLEWPSPPSDSVFRFFKAHSHITTVYIGQTGFQTFMKQFNEFIEVVPNLVVLSMEICRCSWNRATTEEIPKDTQEQTSLQEITLQFPSGNDAPAIVLLKPMFKKIDRWELPMCTRITIWGLSSDGCVDPASILDSETDAAWREAIDLCKDRHINIINRQGEPIYLWKARHGLKYEGTEKGPRLVASADDSDTEDSEDSSWTEDTDSDEEHTDSDDSSYDGDEAKDIADVDESPTIDSESSEEDFGIAQLMSH